MDGDRLGNRDELRCQSIGPGTPYDRPYKVSGNEKALKQSSHSIEKHTLSFAGVSLGIGNPLPRPCLSSQSQLTRGPRGVNGRRGEEGLSTSCNKNLRLILQGDVFPLNNGSRATTMIMGSNSRTRNHKELRSQRAPGPKTIWLFPVGTVAGLY